MRILANPDAEAYKKISEAVKENGGYCPCLAIKTADTKCPCKDFRETNQEGYCHCGRFYKESKGVEQSGGSI